MRRGNRTVAKLRRHSRRHRESEGESRLAEVSARIDSSRNGCFIRRPVFDRDLDVIAYELVLGQGPITDITIEDTDGSERRLVLNSVVTLDLAAMSVGKPLQLTASSLVLESGILAELDPDQVSVVVGARVHPTESVMVALEGLGNRGFRIILDDLETNPQLLPLVRLADAVRINVDGGVRPAMATRIGVLEAAGLELIADRIGTHEEFRNSAKLGFEHFQGSFFTSPDALSEEKASAGQLAALELVTLLHDPEVDINRIAAVIRRDVELSYRVLKTVNSAQYSLPRPFEAIEDAVMVVGTRQIAEWVALMSLSRLADKPSELTRVAMVRARVCELLAERLGMRDRRPFYVVGLLSVIEALLDVPAERALGDLPLSADIVDAIVSGSGVMGEVLRGVVAHEQGNWSQVRVPELGEETVSAAFHTAMLETDEAWAHIAA